jgi:hypothetical protein
MIELTEEDKAKIEYQGWDNVSKFNLSSGIYYGKFTNNDGAFKELFGKKIFDIVGINSAKYYYFQEKECIVSTDLEKQYKNYKPASKYGSIYSLNDLYNIALKFNNKEEVILQINIMHFMDILFSNRDRHVDNYGFTVDENNNAKLIVLDNGQILEEFGSLIIPISTNSNSHQEVYKHLNEEELQLFINNLNQEQKELMIHYLKKFNLKNVYMIMRSIERENKCKFKIKKKLFFEYIKHYMKIYKIVLNTKCKRKELK